MVVGEEDWPFPVPIVKTGKSWFFDTKRVGAKFLLRRIGQNELDAIQICRGYVEAQHEYALKKREGYNVQPVRAKNHQHRGQTGWPCLEKS